MLISEEQLFLLVIFPFANVVPGLSPCDVDDYTTTSVFTEHTIL